MKTWPLRWRIAIWSALASALALLTFTAIVALNLYAEHVELIDLRLKTTAQLVPGESPARLETLRSIARAAGSSGDAALRGFVLVHTRSGAIAHAQPVKLSALAQPWPPRSKPFSRTVDGRRLRVAAFAQGDTTLLLAARLEPAEEALRDLLGSAGIALPLVLLVVAGGSWWIARHALQPIAAITRAAASITADRLGERLPVPVTTDEIGRHTAVLNGMFDRLQRSFEQANRFTADAAHELRTPLTIMRGQVEEALRSGALAPEPERLLVGLLEEITGLQKISDQLLLLARFDTGQNPLQRAPLDLSALLEEAREDAELLAAPQRLKIAAAIAPAIRVDGDPVMLRRVALNLIDNAVKFNRPDGEVRLTLRAEAGEARFTIGNTGAGIPPDRRASLFARFFRGAADHNRESGGSGLGLSLCREIVTAHDGRIELARAEADWTEFSVRLPRLAA